MKELESAKNTISDVKQGVEASIRAADEEARTISAPPEDNAAAKTPEESEPPTKEIDQK